jgi:DNA polymerase III subunit gamma/tau
MSDDPTQSDESSRRPANYLVVARRYRPQVFDELIGQEHIAQALANAIATNRVGHAYLFTGARGVGKTSAARIFAKALDCVTGPGPVPCNECEICQSISSGDDVDVLEIDGASNRGIDEIRQLRQNVNVRPSRARLKIYIIDEVHMLTREAFNALLKTLEEPPGHVKFIFCTTDPNKIPVTILSRCQRFDFAGIQTSSIAKRLAQIAAAERVAAEPEAIDMLARRAAGSMRDGQSLLEQLLALASERITLADVHGMLGTASEGRLDELVGCLVAHDAAGALAGFDAALAQGVDPGLLVEQLFGYLRDCMAAAVGCGPDTFVYASPTSAARVAEVGSRLGVHAILAAMQILDQTLSRLRQSTQARVLAELALVRIADLDELDDLASLVAQLREGTVGTQDAAAPKKNPPAKAVSDRPAERERRSSESARPSGNPPNESPRQPDGPPPQPLTEDSAAEIWSQAVERCTGLLAENARQSGCVAISAPNRLVVVFKPEYTLARSVCQRPENAARLRQALAAVTGQPVEIEFRLDETATAAKPVERAVSTMASSQQRMAEIARHPLVRRANELFDAEPIHVAEGTEKPK